MQLRLLSSLSRKYFFLKMLQQKYLHAEQSSPEYPTSHTQTLSLSKYGSQYPLLLQDEQAVRAKVQPSGELTTLRGFLRSYICLLLIIFRMHPTKPV